MSKILNVLVLSSAQKKSGHDQLELFKRQSIKLFIEFELNFIDFKLNNEYIEERRGAGQNVNSKLQSLKNPEPPTQPP